MLSENRKSAQAPGPAERETASAEIGVYLSGRACIWEESTRNCAANG